MTSGSHSRRAGDKIWWLRHHTAVACFPRISRSPRSSCLRTHCSSSFTSSSFCCSPTTSSSNTRSRTHGSVSLSQLATRTRSVFSFDLSCAPHRFSWSHRRRQTKTRCRSQLRKTRPRHPQCAIIEEQCRAVSSSTTEAFARQRQGESSRSGYAGGTNLQKIWLCGQGKQAQSRLE